MKSTALVPVEPFRRLAQQRLDAIGREGHDKPIEKLIVELDLAPRQVWRIFNENFQMYFSMADQIVTRLNPQLWFSDPELSEIYESIDFRIEDLVNPLDTPAALQHARDQIVGAWEQHPTKNEAAASLGMRRSTYNDRLMGYLGHERYYSGKKKRVAA